MIPGRALWLAALLALGPAPALAQLQPTKPSQLVTILSGSTPCGLSLSGRAIDNVSDSGPPLAIPAKQVLVITDVEVLQFGLDPGATGFVAFDFEPENRSYFSMFVNAGPTGEAYGQRTFAQGIVVKPGTTICTFQDNTNWTLRGYFTKDK